MGHTASGTKARGHRQHGGIERPDDLGHTTLALTGPVTTKKLTREYRLINRDLDEFGELCPSVGADFIPSRDDQADAVTTLNAGTTDYWCDAWPDPLTLATVDDFDYRARLAYESDRVASGPLF